MNAFRKIMRTENTQVFFEVPQEFVQKTLEIIVLPMDNLEQANVIVRNNTVSAFQKLKSIGKNTTYDTREDDVYQQ
jgi:hypothetical protein